MVKRRSETDEPKEVPPAMTPDGEARGEEDSIEILEVVGMEPEAASKSLPETQPSLIEAGEGDDDSIPYGRRELYDMLLRSQAEFDNARKRMEREKQEGRQRLWMDLLRRLLPILDNFDRALHDPASGEKDAFRQGVELTVQQMRDFLVREGLEEIRALGEKFDPHLHEAVEIQSVEGFEEGMVLEELRKGYRFQGQLLRPTLVRVSAGRASQGPGEP
jgi:molecular chaperone GrpE